MNSAGGLVGTGRRAPARRREGSRTARMRINVPATAAWLAGLAALALSSSATRADYVRPFGADAPWNVPVAGLPQAPQSGTYVEKLWSEGSNQPGNFNLSFDSYTYPVYDARQAIGT